MIAEIDYDIITEIDINKNQYKLLSFNKEDGNTFCLPAVSFKRKSET